MSHFFAYLSRMKFIRRWSLMRNSHPENIQEHSLRVAMIAHNLAVIRNHVFGGAVDPQRTAVLALFHDSGEVITGDLPTPIKNFNPAIKDAYRGIEKVAGRRLFDMIPDELKVEYESIFFPDAPDREHMELVHAADKLCAYLKCMEELGAGNREFVKAEKSIKSMLKRLHLPEVDYFLKTYVPSFSLTLDELD
jgi:5'-deoxynucleotidase